MATNIDKNLLISRFSKSFGTYKNNAEVQKQMADELFRMIEPEFCNKAVSVYEFGCGNGMLTEQLVNLHINRFHLNDLAPSALGYINDICGKAQQEFSFSAGDAEIILPEEKFDLIISGSTIQWFADLPSFFNRITSNLNKNGMFAFSTFGPQNLSELQALGFPHISYPDLDTIKAYLQKAGLTIIEANEELKTIYFPSPLDILRHLKLTGVNALSHTKWTKGKLLEFCNKYSNNFTTASGCKLTYHSIKVSSRTSNI